MNVCSKCDTPFKHGDFNCECVAEAQALPREVLLKQLLDSGGCGQEYYDSQIKKLKETTT